MYSGCYSNLFDWVPVFSYTRGKEQTAVTPGAGGAVEPSGKLSKPMGAQASQKENWNVPFAA